MFEACRHATTYTASWIDGAARGSSLGRGLIEMSEPAEGNDLDVPERRKLTVPITMPNWLLNGLTVRMFNAIWYRRVPKKGRDKKKPIGRTLYVLDSFLKWNRVYGTRGFRQFQCVIPDERAGQGLRAMLETVEHSGVFPFLGVLKTLGGEGIGHLSFPMRGYTLALDFPNQKGSLDLLSHLEAIVLNHHGRIYLAKDFAMSPESFRQMYPKHSEFRAVLNRHDPGKKISSDLARRLRIRD
jgi:decaprenylphospho-beta-D-ribofuranose 2-oxidase